MPVLRKRSQIHDNKTMPSNGLYIHSSPPRVLQLSSARIKQLIRSGDVDKLEQVVMEGHGKKLIGEYSADYKTRTFLKTVPFLMSQISLLHDAVNSGRLEELQSILDENPDKKKKLVLAKDEAGVGLLHKAVYYDLKEIYKYLINNFPHIVSMKDAEGRTAYHYTPMCKDSSTVQKLLTNAGADATSLDFRQHSAKYYMDHVQELELPSSHKSVVSSRKSTVTNESLNFKKSNIRIWIHQRNLTNLQQVVWEGHGSKLLVEHSNNPKIRKFLEAVPHIMGLIKDVHTDTQNGDLQALKNHVNPPVPPVVFSGKDANGLTPLHKASGLGKYEIAEFIVTQYPKCVNIIDNEGRTPLHYAAPLKDDGKMMNFLLENGADESILDNKQKTAAYYKNRNSELDQKLLGIVPECPRSAKEAFAANWDWSIITSCAPAEEIMKHARKVEHIITKENGHHEEKDVQKEIELSQDIGNKTNDVTEETLKTEDNPEKESENNEEQTKETELENNNETEENTDPENNEEENPKPESTKTPTEDNNVDQNEEINEQNEESGEAKPKSRPGTTTLEKSRPPSGAIEQNNSIASRSQSREKENNSRNESSLNKESSSNSRNESQRSKENSSNSRNESRRSKESSSKSRSDSRKSKGSSGNSRSGSREQLSAEVESVGVIEGVVNGENEVETLNEEGQGKMDDNSSDNNNNTDIPAMVEAGNMEQLAALVLNGEGEKLIGQQSDNPELQSFLDNVSTYMSKINRIHLAARNGSLRDLQAALDRRKFAIAKDSISPNGASPLHTAVIFGNTSIVRYLAGRFPETVHMVDDNGRTPLHYAAVLADNGHYYNLLVHLGADIRIEDKFGNDPEYYRVNQDDFTHKSLLRDFGAEDGAYDEILNDKGVVVPSNGQVDMPFFATEEGRYLASSLGDPLIKGLTEVANKRPEDPIAYLATYLYNFANNRNEVRSRGKTQEIENKPESQQIAENSSSVPASIDVVTVEPDENGLDEDSAFNSTSRDEHGQSMLHFAAARGHGRNALFQLLLETEINVAYRDELYRTARDISIQANIPENTMEIDRYVMHIATSGDTDKLVELLLDGYDHITDIVDEEENPIVEAVSKQNQPDTVSFLQSILTFEEKRERVHHAIRLGSATDVMTLLADENDTGSGKLLALGKNSYGRCSLHIAVLCQQEEIVDYLANTFQDTLKLGDNLERTALHYAMGVEKMESISRVLIKAGAMRVIKDLKGRQPTYYFLNKSDILRLQEEEETF